MDKSVKIYIINKFINLEKKKKLNYLKNWKSDFMSVRGKMRGYIYSRWVEVNEKIKMKFKILKFKIYIKML